MRKIKEFYPLKKELCGVPAGTIVRIHDWNDIAVQISLQGDLMWLTNAQFLEYFTEITFNEKELNRLIVAVSFNLDCYGCPYCMQCPSRAIEYDSVKNPVECEKQLKKFLEKA